LVRVKTPIFRTCSPGSLDACKFREPATGFKIQMQDFIARMIRVGRSLNFICNSEGYNFLKTPGGIRQFLLLA
jgi:hypothetical protein